MGIPHFGNPAGGIPNFGNLPGMMGPDMQNAAARMMSDPNALQTMLQVRALLIIHSTLAVLSMFLGLSFPFFNLKFHQELTYRRDK